MWGKPQPYLPRGVQIWRPQRSPQKGLWLWRFSFGNAVQADPSNAAVMKHNTYVIK
jgi:hypothetical protein